MKEKENKIENEKQNKTKLEHFMIKDPLVTWLNMEKHAVYFEFLKRFIDIPFVKTVRRISF